MIDMNRSILVVDDDQAIADVAKILLSMRGWNVVVANSGKDALELFQPGAFDIVLVDYSMPGMRGDKLIAAMRDRAPAQRMILMSGFVDFEPPPNTGFLHKPFGLAELEQAIGAPHQALCPAG